MQLASSTNTTRVAVERLLKVHPFNTRVVDDWEFNTAVVDNWDSTWEFNLVVRDDRDSRIDISVPDFDPARPVLSLLIFTVLSILSAVILSGSTWYFFAVTFRFSVSLPAL